MGFGSTKNIAAPEPKLFGAQRERIATNESARVLPWFAGTRWLGVTWLGDVFGVRTSPIREKIGKKKQTTGYKYYACFVGLICNGIVDRITRIRFDDEIVWEGSLERGTADFTTITIENRGNIHFHWGTETQILHPKLVASGQNHSAYRGQCYIVGDDIFLGPDRTTVPNIQVRIERVGKPTSSWYTIEHLIGSDANPVTVLWEWWTNKRFGCGRSESDLDTSRLATAAGTLLSEGLGISPLITSETEMKNLLIQLFEHCDAYPTSYSGKFGIELVRTTSSTVSTLSKTSLMADPRIATQQWPDTFNEVRVRFKDDAKDGEDNVAKHHEMGNFQITGRHKALNVERPWVTSHDVAARIAGALGRVNGLPQASGRLQVRESTASALVVGSVFDLQTRDGELMRMRVTERADAGPDRRQVELGFESDRAWANSEYFIPEEEAMPERSVFSPEPIAAAQIQDAPYAFADPNLSTLVWFVSRGDTHSTGYDVWKASADAGPYEAASDRRSADIFQNFSVQAKLKVQYPSETSVIDDVTGITFQVLSTDDELLEDEWDLDDALNHTLLAFFGSTSSEIMSLYEVAAQGGGVYTAKTVRGLYDTRRRTHALGTTIWLQLRTKIDAYSWPPFSESVRYYKFQSRFGQAESRLDDTGSIQHTENARSLLPIVPQNLRVNGDAHHPTWTAGNDITVSWSNTSRARSVFGLPFNEAPETDLTNVSLELRSYDGTTLHDTAEVSPTEEQTTITSAYLVSEVNNDFSIRAYGVRNGKRSLDYNEVFVRKVA